MIPLLKITHTDTLEANTDDDEDEEEEKEEEENDLILVRCTCACARCLFFSQTPSGMMRGDEHKKVIRVPFIRKKRINQRFSPVVDIDQLFVFYSVFTLTNFQVYSLIKYQTKRRKQTNKDD